MYLLTIRSLTVFFFVLFLFLFMFREVGTRSRCMFVAMVITYNVYATKITIPTTVET